MRLTVHAAGSRGDVEPLVVLAGRLAREGFDVALATEPSYAELAERNGVPLRAVHGIDPAVVVRSEMGDRLGAAGTNPLRFMHTMRELVEPRLEEMTRETLDAAQGADALVIGRTAIAAYSVAEVLGIPFVDASIYPLVPTRAFPSVLLPRLPYRPRLNVLSHHAVQQANWLLFRGVVNDVRDHVLGLPRLGLRAPFAGHRVERHPMVCGFSEALVPRPADWPPEVEITGFWQARPEGHALADDLAAFIADGPRPVYIGFGSAIRSNGDETAVREAVWEGVRRARVRAVVQGAWAQDAPENVFVAGDVVHADLFPHMAAVVHHGGIGTVSAGLLAGRPTLCVPHYADMFFWATRVARIGAGPQPIPIDDLDAARLAAGLRAATTDPRIAQRAARVGEALRAEDGPGAAARAIARALGG